MNYRLYLFMVMFFNTGCNSEHFSSLRFSEYKQYLISQSHTNVTLLKSFVNDIKCDSIKNIFYANVFLCKIDNTDDTIMVFNICKKPYDFLKSDYKGPKGFAIDSSTVIKKHPVEVLIAIDTFVLRKKYQYIVADIGNYLED